MNYYIYEDAAGGAGKTSMTKARADVNLILNGAGFQRVDVKTSVHSGVQRVARQVRVLRAWREAFSRLKRGDTLLLQFPPIENSVFMGGAIRCLSRDGVNVVFLVHDMISRFNTSSWVKRMLYSYEEKNVFDAAERIIVHNRHMKEELPYDQSKMVPLEIFDYLIENYQPEKMAQRAIGKNLPVIIAGSLKPKYAGAYLSELPEELEYNLYGIGYEDRGEENVHYFGSFPPDDLPYELTGSFGLVWYGDSANGCKGDRIREYIKIINPHRASLYIASGIPLIAWREAAIADFILENRCGFVVDSLYEIRGIIDRLTAAEYETMKRNADTIGERLRSGYYLRSAIENSAM